MTPTERKRIEKEAMKYVDQFNNIAPKSAYKTGYIAGAIAEHNLLKPQLEYADNYIKMLTEDRDKLASKLREKDKARNQAIQDCIDIVSVTPGDENVIPKLEKLKAGTGQSVQYKL